MSLILALKKKDEVRENIDNIFCLKYYLKYKIIVFFPCIDFAVKSAMHSLLTS